MKAISAHVTGFYRSSFHAYTTEVEVDGHRWRLGLRYSKFHEFYDKLALLEPEFSAPFPPKGTLFFTPKPEERQEQLEEFLQQVLAHYVAQSHPVEMGELLCELLKVPRHLKAPEREDDDVSTSTESVLDEPMHEPPADSAAVEKVAAEEQTQAADDEVAQQAPVKQAEPEIPVVEEQEEKIVAAAEMEQPVSPVAQEPQEVEEIPIAHEEVQAEVETSMPAEEAEEATYAAKEDVAALEKEAAQEEETEPQLVTELSTLEAVVEEEDAVAEAVAAVPEVASTEQPGAESVAQTEKLAAPQAAASESGEASPKELVEESKELATTGLVPSWIAAYLPKSLLGFIRRRCLKKTNLVMLCVALLLPMVLARR